MMNTDLSTWLKEVGFKRTFRMLEYKKIFTPYEQEQKFRDETGYKDDHFQLIKIVEVIELPDKDLLIGYGNVYDDDLDQDENKWVIEYRKLSDIELSYYPDDDLPDSNIM